MAGKWALQTTGRYSGQAYIILRVTPRAQNWEPQFTVRNSNCTVDKAQICMVMFYTTWYYGPAVLLLGIGFDGPNPPLNPSFLLQGTALDYSINLCTGINPFSPRRANDLPVFLGLQRFHYFDTKRQSLSNNLITYFLESHTIIVLICTFH